MDGIDGVMMNIMVNGGEEGGDLVEYSTIPT